MRLSEVQLRSFIRETLKSPLDEMSWAGHLGIVRPEEQSYQDLNSSMIDQDSVLSDVNLDAAEKYALSKKFAELAEKYFAKLPFRVWTAPIISHEYTSVMNQLLPGGNDRARKVDLVPEGLEILKNLGFTDLERIDPQQDMVILYNTSKQKQIPASVTGTVYNTMRIATPWMIFHAMFDHQTRQENKDMAEELVNWWQSGDTGPFRNARLYRQIPPEIGNIFTMKSARIGQLDLSNVAAEAIAQELLTTGGFTYNLPDNVSPEVAQTIQELYDRVKELGKAWKSQKTNASHQAQGRLFIVRSLG